MGKYFTEQERYKLEVCLQAKMKIKDIAKLLNKCERTIYYEIKRGKITLRNSDYTEKTIYQADVSQNKYNETKTNKGVQLKIGNDMKFVKYIEDMIINKKYSPYAALENIKTNNLSFNTSICTTTLYSYIHKGIFLNVNEKDMPQMKLKKNKDNKRKVALNNKKGKSIEQRPKDILKRQEIGHWEMDTVVSGQGKSKYCLLVLSERTTREEQIYKIPNKQCDSVIKVLNKIEKQMGTKTFRNTYKTITCDNGVEFLDYENLEKSIRNKTIKRTTIFYCHPYTSCERGTNENQNRLIRRFIPKGADISQYSNNDIKQIEHWINNYPRKLFNGLSSNQKKKELDNENIA